VARVEIQAIDTAKPTKASSGRDWDGAWLLLLVLKKKTGEKDTRNEN